MIYALIAVGVLLIGGVFAVAMMASRSKQTNQISERLEMFTERAMSLEELELQMPFSQRVLLPTATRVLSILGRVNPSTANEKVKTNLMLAGNPGNLTPAMFTGLRIVGSVVIGGLMVLLTSVAGMESSQKLLYGGLGFVLGYLVPGMWLGSQIKKRQKGILKALPDALDLLCISVEAGLGFDLALQRVAEKWDNELCREFRRVLSDQQLGMPSREALKSMVVRSGVDDVATFVAAVVQAQQLGVSMGKILKIQSDQLRLRRRQRAEEQAQKAPVKMLFPMVFLIFPALFVVILGPAVPRLMGGIG